MHVKLKEIAEISLGKSLTRISKKYTGEKTEKEILYQKKYEVYTEKGEVAKNIDEKSLAKDNDIIFKMADPQVAIKVSLNSQVKPGTVITSKFAIIRVTSPEINVDYLTYLLNSQVLSNQLNKFNEGIIKQVKISDLNNLELKFPSLEKQEEIVEYLQLIDEKMILIEELLDENKNLKEAIIEEFSR